MVAEEQHYVFLAREVLYEKLQLIVKPRQLKEYKKDRPTIRCYFEESVCER